MTEVDMEESAHLVIIADGVGIRTVVSMSHQDGFQLLNQLTEYYGRIEYGNSDEQPKREGLLKRLAKRFGL